MKYSQWRCSNLQRLRFFVTGVFLQVRVVSPELNYLG
jgi:hypothetical protein